MAITRFNKFTPRDYQMDWYVPKEIMPNIEAWSGLLQEQQNKFDTTKMLLSDKLPKYLQTEEDRQLFQQYKQLADSTLDNITKQYQENGITAGNQAMKEAVRLFNREWMPGGMANVLEDRYAGYQKGLEEIEKTYKEDSRGINKQYAQEQLRKQLSNPLNYNKETGEYSRINTPELFKDPNIQNLILKAVDQVKESGNTDIVRLSPTMLQKIKTEGRSGDVLASIAQSIYEQYPQQLAIESWYRGKNIDPQKVQERYISNIDKQIAKQDELLTRNLSKEEVKQLQSELVKNGYDITIDGIMGKNTKSALEQQISKNKQELNRKKESFDFNNYVESEIRSDYDKFARSFANQKVDKSIIFDQAELTRQRIAANRKDTQSLISAAQQIANPETNLVGATPDKGINLEAWSKQKENANKSLQDANNVYNKIMGGKAGQILGTNANNVASLIEAYSKTGGDPNAFYNLIQSDPKYTASRKIDLKAAFDYIQNNGDVISQATDAVIQAQENKNLLETVEKSVTRHFITNEGKNDFEYLKKQYKKPWETDEQFLDAVINKDVRFIKQGASVRTNDFTDSGERRNINEAESFLNKRNTVVKESKDPTYAKSIRTAEISAPTEDKAVGGFAKSILADIDNNDYYGYVDEGQQGFSWKTKEGKEKEGIVSNKRVSIVSTGDTGKPQIKVTGVIKNADGEESYVETYLNIPDLRKDQVKQVVLASKAQAKRTNDNHLDEVADITLGGLNNDINYTKVAAQDAINLHYDNTQSIPVSMPVYNNKGEIYTTRSTEMRGMLMDTDEVNGRIYKKYKVLGDEGQSYYRLTMQTPQGEVIITNKNGGMNFNSSSSVDNFINGKKYDMSLSVNTKLQKVPTGQGVSNSQIGAIGMLINNRQSNAEESFDEQQNE